VCALPYDTWCGANYVLNDLVVSVKRFQINKSGAKRARSNLFRDETAVKTTHTGPHNRTSVNQQNMFSACNSVHGFARYLVTYVK
jgi:hypothetical protein